VVIKGMQRYRLRTSTCDTADMTHGTIPILFPIRKRRHFAPPHSPDSPDAADSLIFFLIPKRSLIRLGNGAVCRSFAGVMETWRDLFLAPGGARGDVPPPPVARVINSLFALLVLIGIVWISLATLHLDWMSVWNYRVMLWKGWVTTLSVIGAALILSTIMGFILALFQRSFVLPLRYLARFFVEVVRCIPLLALIYLVWYGVEGAFRIGRGSRASAKRRSNRPAPLASLAFRLTGTSSFPRPSAKSCRPWLANSSR